MNPTELSSSDALALMAGYVRRWGLIIPGEGVVVGVSGGPDSTALLALMCDVANRWNLQVTAAHLDHGINREMGEAAWAQTRHLTRRLGVRWIARREDVPQRRKIEGGSLHQVARAVRYRFFSSVASEVGASVIATGHTADDQAETVLMRLLRGAGPLGASGIPPKRELRDAMIVRPLLAHRKRALRAICIERDLPFIDDPANVEVSFLRSRVRHEVIPLLEKAFGHEVVPHLAAFAERLREEQEALDRDAQAVLSDPQVERTPTAVVVPTALLDVQSPSLQKRCVVRALEALQGQAPRVKAVHLDYVAEAIAREQAGKKVSLPGGWEISVGSRAVRIGRPASEEPPLEPLSLPYPGSTDVPELGVRVLIEKRRVSHDALPTERGNEAYMGEKAIRDGLTLRTRRPGDTIVPLGGPGRRKLKKVLIDRKVPRPMRSGVPIITTGEGPQEEILWVVGVVLSESCRLDPDATDAWHVQAEPMEERGTVASG